jgi:circadian clock protein KaiB
MDKPRRRATRAANQMPEPAAGRYVLRLYVSGMTPRSSAAIASIRALCDTYLRGRYDLEVIDIYQQPQLAKEGQVIAVPMLVKELPVPLRRLIGNLVDEDRLLKGLDLQRQD